MIRAEWLKLSEARRLPHNSKLHDLDDLGRSMDEFGFVDRIIVNEVTGNLISGHGRLDQLAKRKKEGGAPPGNVQVVDGEWLVPADYIECAVEKEDALSIRLNLSQMKGGRVDLEAMLGSFDLEKLYGQAVAAQATGFLESTGLTEKALAFLKDEVAPEEEKVDAGAQVDKAEELRGKWGVATGQLWRLGEHRLICGDCTDRAVVERVMGGEKAQVCLTDPPYGLGDGKESGKNEYDLHEDSRDNLERLAAKWLPIARDISSVVVFSPGVTNAWIYPEADWIMCWFYGGGQLRSPWGFNCWQPFLCYGKEPSLASGNGGRPDAVDMNTPANAGDIDHPCPKPLKLWEWFIGRLSFDAGDTFYDPFSGSGTTLIACERLGRKCRAIEISPGYVAVAIQRWVDMTGKRPELLG